MNPPNPDVSPENAQRVAATIEWLAKIAGSLAIVWAFIAKVGRPFVEWRRRTRADAIRLVLKEELQCIADLQKREEQVNEKLDLALERQEQVFSEVDLFVAVMADNRDQLDEMRELLNAGGFASRERRTHTERREAADAAMAELQGRLRGRRRKEDQFDRVEPLRGADND